MQTLRIDIAAILISILGLGCQPKGKSKTSPFEGYWQVKTEYKEQIEQEGNNDIGLVQVTKTGEVIYPKMKTGVDFPLFVVDDQGKCQMTDKAVSFFEESLAPEIAGMSIEEFNEYLPRLKMDSPNHLVMTYKAILDSEDTSKVSTEYSLYFDRISAERFDVEVLKFQNKMKAAR